MNAQVVSNGFLFQGEKKSLGRIFMRCVLVIFLASSFLCLGCFNKVVKTRSVPYTEMETVTETQYVPEMINGKIVMVPKQVEKTVPVTKVKEEEYTEKEFAVWRTIWWWVIFPSILVGVIAALGG